MADVVVFAPSPVLTVTVENHRDDADIHLHAGGQGVWQARMLVTLGASVTMCSVFAGESGQVLRHLIADEGIEVVGVDGSGYNGAYIHDRRSGERVVIAEAASSKLDRHDLDELYGLTIGTSLDAGAVVLSGPTDEETVPADVYRRLASDLRSAQRPVVADLSAERLTAALAGGLTVVKVSDDELLADGRVTGTSRDELIDALHRLHADGAANVIITRAEDPVLVLADGAVRELRMPKMEVVDTRGAGDSLTAGVAATLARDGSMEEAVQVGVAAGALNVTRHGLGTGHAEALLKLKKLVTTHTIEAERSHRVTPRELAGRADEE
jgi:1-phosphofructokinase